MKISHSWHLNEVQSYTFPDIKMGNWGGGWNYKLGLALSKTTLMIELLILSISIYWGNNHE